MPETIDSIIKRAAAHGGIYLVRYYDSDFQQSMERATPLTSDLREVELARALADRGVDVENVAGPLSNDTPIRILAGNVCTFVFRSDHHYVVISYAKGHAIVKSLKRIGRRALKAILKIDAAARAAEMRRTMPVDSPAQPRRPDAFERETLNEQ